MNISEIASLVFERLGQSPFFFLEIFDIIILQSHNSLSEKK